MDEENPRYGERVINAPNAKKIEVKGGRLEGCGCLLVLALGFAAIVTPLSIMLWNLAL